ncbi:MAG: hypothetical protein E7E39_04970, partial [Veillonella sp.]|nr:hypothetical protein [Veillonella sp.]
HVVITSTIVSVIQSKLYILISSFLYILRVSFTAQQYFNKIIKNSELRSMYIDFYNQLKEIPKENISLGVSEFYGSTMIEFAYINGIIIEEE